MRTRPRRGLRPAPTAVLTALLLSLTACGEDASTEQTELRPGTCFDDSEVPALKTGALRTVSCDGEHDNEVVAVLPSQVDGVAVDKSPRDRCLTEAGQKWRRGDLDVFAVASASSVACVVFRSDHTPLKQRLIG